MLRLILTWAVCGLVVGGLQAETQLTVTSPLNYQVIQRDNLGHGRLLVQGRLEAENRTGLKIECRLNQNSQAGEWQALSAVFDGDKFSAPLELPAGGWYGLDLRATRSGVTDAERTVEHVGVGELFVVAGQSNSANHGEEKQSPQTGLVAAFDGAKWQLAHDPQPGASGGGGSFIPALGDDIARRLKVPVGFVACGIGATSVREWLPKGSTFPNPPTIESRVTKRADGLWESKGEAFDMFVARMRPLGQQGFRAVLWHQGESDANQRDPSRTLAGPLYRQSLETVIRESRREIGWAPPWFVAQVSYHVPGDESSLEIRAAQASLWKDGIALEGPDSDSLKSEWREGGGKGVHFSGPGLRKHAQLWAEKIVPWIESQMK
jgi:hypothetical protein